MHPIFQTILLALDIYIWIIIATVVMSWLVAFNVINTQNQFVRQVHYALYRLTEPVLGRIRRYLPDLGGLDLSPIVLLLGIFFLQSMIAWYGPQLL